MRKFIYFGEGMCPSYLANQLRSCGVQVETDIRRIPEKDIDEKHKAQVEFFRKCGAYSADFDSLGEEMLVTILFKKGVKFDKNAIEKIIEMTKDDVRGLSIDNAGSNEREFAISYCYPL